MFGGFGSRSRTFNDSFRCHSVSLLAAEQQRDPALLEYSDKIILPPSCLEKLAHLEITYPMIFELCNPHDLQRRLHCGVLEFIAQEGMVYLPYWMMENMHLNEGLALLPPVGWVTAGQEQGAKGRERTWTGRVI